MFYPLKIQGLLKMLLIIFWFESIPLKTIKGNLSVMRKLIVKAAPVAEWIRVNRLNFLTSLLRVCVFEPWLGHYSVQLPAIVFYN